MKNKPYSIFVWILFLLFCFRVSAQLIQYFIPVSFLPPFESWHSATLMYPVLVLFQFIIIFFYLRSCIRLTNGKIVANKTIGKRLLILGGIYAFVMIIRYVLRMAMFPAERWLGGSIPILFHIVLASFLITLGFYHFFKGSPEIIIPRKPIRILWNSLYLVLILLIPVWLFYQLLPAIISNQIGLRPTSYSVAIEKKVPVTMHDGVILYSDIYRPEKLSPAPTILVRIPLDDNLKGKMMSNVVGRIWAERGFNVMIQGVRGRFNSTEKHIPFMHEREDGIATLKWLNQQPWHNGKTGMWGGSYFGYTQWVLADQDSLGLAAMLTQISSSSNYRMFYPGKTFAYESALFWATRSHSDKDTPLDYETLRKGYDKAPMIRADERTVGDIPFYNDWVIHDYFDEYWKEVDGIERAKKLSVPVLMMAGWYDPFLSSQVQDFEDVLKFGDSEVSKKSRLVIGPWSHAETVTMPDGFEDRNYRLSSIAPSIDWFDQHIGKRKIKNIPPVEIFVMGINEWRYEGSFPLERTEYTAYNLSVSDNEKKNSKGFLVQDSLTYDSLEQTYLFDPASPVPSIGGSVLGARAGAKKQNEIENRNDILIYTSPLLKRDVEVIGKVKLILYVSTSVICTDFMAKLCDVHPDGTSYNISEGAIRKNYSGKLKIEQIEIELNPTANVFLQGHQIRLQITSSNYPRYSLNYNTGNNNYDEEKGIMAKQKVYTGKSFPSQLILPLIPSNKIEIPGPKVIR